MVFSDVGSEESLDGRMVSIKEEIIDTGSDTDPTTGSSAPPSPTLHHTCPHPPSTPLPLLRSHRSGRDLNHNLKITLLADSEDLSQRGRGSQPASSPARRNIVGARCNEVVVAIGATATPTATAVLEERGGGGSVILVSRDRRTGKREHVVLHSLLKAITTNTSTTTTTTRVNNNNPGRVEKRVVLRKGSPRIDFRNASMGSRTQLKRNLERQQFMEMQEEEKRQQQQRQQQQSQTIAMPSVYHSAEVPPKVLQVKTELSHPTMYHIRQKQQQAVKTFLNESDDHHVPAHSMPNLAIQSTMDAPWISGSAPTELESDSITTDLDDVEFSALINNTLELVEENDLHSITPSLMQMSSTLPPQQQLYGQQLTLEVDSAGAKSSSSCPPVFPSQVTQVSPPPHLSEEEQKMWARDRQKKDNHNMIERRRRYNINDRIKELGSLLPKSYDQDMRANKGSILKASVDYIKKLRKESEQLRAEKEGRAQAEKAAHKMQLKFTQLCALVKQNGLMFNGMEEICSMDMMVAPGNIMNLAPSTSSTSTVMASSSQLLCMDDHISVFSGMVPMQDYTSPDSSHIDFMEDTSSPVNSDPMLTSAPVSPDHDDSTL